MLIGKITTNALFLYKLICTNEKGTWLLLKWLYNMDQGTSNKELKIEVQNWTTNYTEIFLYFYWMPYQNLVEMLFYVIWYKKIMMVRAHIVICLTHPQIFSDLIWYESLTFLTYD